MNDLISQEKETETGEKMELRTGSNLGRLSWIGQLSIFAKSNSKLGAELSHERGNA